MKQRINFIVLALVAGMGLATLSPGPVSAIAVFNNCAGGGNSSVCNSANTDKADSMVKIIINTLLSLLGIVAVIMIIVGAIRYTASAGDAARVKGAKDTVMYSVVGLIVAILSYTIVNFVLDKF
jgi:hypothetical protein